MHPAVFTVDIMVFDIELLHELLDVPGLADRIDVVNLSEDTIDSPFVTYAVSRKAPGGVVEAVSPPRVIIGVHYHKYSSGSDLAISKGDNYLERRSV
jgi:hypothetical protein